MVILNNNNQQSNQSLWNQMQQQPTQAQMPDQTLQQPQMQPSQTFEQSSTFTGQPLPPQQQTPPSGASSTPPASEPVNVVVTPSKAPQQKVVTYEDLRYGNYFTYSWNPAINLFIPPDEFLANSKIDLQHLVSVKEFTTKSGKVRRMNYIAWTDSLRFLRMYNPDLDAGVEEYQTEDGYCLPYMCTQTMGAIVGAFVFSKSTGRRTPAIYLAVRGSKLESIVTPLSGDITNTMQRAIAKAIAQYTGIGWNIYAGDESLDDLANPGEQPNEIMSDMAAAMGGMGMGMQMMPQQQQWQQPMMPVQPMYGQQPVVTIPNQYRQ